MFRDAERRGLLLLLLPYLVGLIGLIGIPAAFTVVMSLFEYDLVRSPVFVGLTNFGELVGDRIFHGAMLSSLAFVLVAVPLRLLGALGLGLLLHKPMRGAGLYRAAVYLPTVVPEIAYALIWVWLLNPLYGPINLTLGALGLPTPGWLTDPVAARWGVVLLSLFIIGEGVLVAIAARRLIPGELYEMAATERAGPFATFRHITLPLMAPVSSCWRRVTWSSAYRSPSSPRWSSSTAVRRPTPRPTFRSSSIATGSSTCATGTRRPRPWSCRRHRGDHRHPVPARPEMDRCRPPLTAARAGAKSPRCRSPSSSCCPWR